MQDSEEISVSVVISFFCHLDIVHRPTNTLKVGTGKRFDSVQVFVSE